MQPGGEGGGADGAGGERLQFRYIHKDDELYAHPATILLCQAGLGLGAVWFKTRYRYCIYKIFTKKHRTNIIVKLRRGSGKDREGMAVKANGLKA